MSRMNTLHTCMPSISEWGMGRKMGTEQQLIVAWNEAKAFQAARAAGLSEDVCLAVAACVLERGKDAEPILHVSVDLPKTSGIVGGFRVHVEYIGGEASDFGLSSIMDYHIPTITKEYVRSEERGEHLPEALLSRWVGVKGAYNQEHDVRIAHGDDLSLPIVELCRAGGRQKQKTVFARFPLSRLRLTQNEYDLVREGAVVGSALVCAAHAEGRQIDGYAHSALKELVERYREAHMLSQDEERATVVIPREVPTQLYRNISHFAR